MHNLSLKSLAGHNLKSALEKAAHYRALNQPDEAESICEDVLAVEPGNQEALRVLGLAITDGLEHSVEAFDHAMKVFTKLTSEYERVYHQGVARERLGKAHLARAEALGALTALEHALEHFDRASAIAPPGVADSLLRWNRCVRLMHAHRVLQDALDAPRSRQPGLGD
jgi:tetratricopeptide (TPR) repeat protein